MCVIFTLCRELARNIVALHIIENQTFLGWHSPCVGEKGLKNGISGWTLEARGPDQKACRVRDKDDPGPGPGLARPWRMLLIWIYNKLSFKPSTTSLQQGCVTHRLEIKTMTSSTHFPFPLCCFWNVQRALFNMIDKCGWIHNKLCLSFYKTPSLALKKTKAKWNSCESVQLYL